MYGTVGSLAACFIVTYRMLATSAWIATYIVLALFAFVMVSGYLHRRSAGRVTSTASMKGKTVIITGASAGIGKEAARDIARRGARVILACRNLKKARDVAENIELSTGNSQVLVRQLDTSSLTSVRNFAAKILAEEPRLDVLALNAGIGGEADLILTEDGLELTMATNHFGHFLLANLLLGLLKKSSPSRIVVTASMAHKFLKTLDLKNLIYENGDYGSFRAYCQSKSCNILFARHLAEMLKGTGVVVNALCPGFVATEIFTKSSGFMIGKLFKVFVPLSSRTEEQGAQTIVHLAVSEEGADISGKVFEDCKVSRKAASIVQDTGLAKKVWEASEEYVKLKPEERLY